MRTNFYDDVGLFMGLGQAATERFNLLSPEARVKTIKDIEDEKERNRVEWFINQGTCPYCKTKLKRGKKDKNHVRKWWCIKCNINLSKE